MPFKVQFGVMVFSGQEKQSLDNSEHYLPTFVPKLYCTYSSTIRSQYLPYQYLPIPVPTYTSASVLLVLILVPVPVLNYLYVILT
jgi:hypothetical protein